jgi:hypothetical protein
MDEFFTCDKYDLNIPQEKQHSFCAIQFRKERAICIDCEHGRNAAKEDRNMEKFDKKCKVCEKEFTAGRTATTCPDCKASAVPSEKPKKNGKKPRKNAARAASSSIPADDPGNGSHESIKVLETLVAIGAITDTQVEATRKYVREMFA